MDLNIDGNELTNVSLASSNSPKNLQKVDRYIEEPEPGDRTSEIADLRDGLLEKAQDMLDILKAGEFDIAPTPYNIKTITQLALELDKIIEIRKSDKKSGGRNRGQYVEFTERKAMLKLDDIQQEVSKAGLDTLTKDLEKLYE